MYVKQDDYRLQNLTFFVTVKEIFTQVHSNLHRLLEPSPFGEKFNDPEYIITICFSCRVPNYSCLSLNLFEVVALCF